MYNSISQFLKDWDYESNSTLKVLNNLTNESLSQKVSEDGRSLGFIAWHLAQTIPEMMGRTGLKIDGPGEKEAVPDSSKKISDGYDKATKSFIDQLQKSWKDSDLSTVDDMYGFKWSRGMTLYFLMLHQTHHRGQMTVLMRQAGLKVPGIYGPSKEEWAEHGMEPLP